MKHDYNLIMSKKYRCPVCFTSKFVWNADDFEMQKTLVRTMREDLLVKYFEQVRIECLSCGFNFSVEV